MVEFYHISIQNSDIIHWKSVFSILRKIYPREGIYFFLKRFIFGSTWRPKKLLFHNALTFSTMAEFYLFPIQNSNIYTKKIGFFNFAKNLSKRRYLFFSFKGLYLGLLKDPKSAFSWRAYFFDKWSNFTLSPYKIRILYTEKSVFSILRKISERR